MDFKSEMREELKKYFGRYQGGVDGWGEEELLNSDSIEEALSSLLALIEKKMPKEITWDNGQPSPFERFKSGFNQCLSEIKKEMGI